LSAACNSRNAPGLPDDAGEKEQQREQRTEGEDRIVGQRRGVTRAIVLEELLSRALHEGQRIATGEHDGISW
jgi:hypothetical protein